MELVKFIESMADKVDFSTIKDMAYWSEIEEDEACWERMKEKAIELIRQDGALAYSLGDDDLDVIQRIGKL